MKVSAFILLGCLVVLLSCEQPGVVFKDNADIADGKWYVKNTPSFTFTITDTTAHYNLYYMLRNNRSYPYYNLYLTRYFLDDKGQDIESRLDELILMDAKTGKPNGEGLGDLYDHKVLMKSQYRFPKAGRYTIRLKQYMRQDPLPDVLSVGVSIEKAN